MNRPKRPICSACGAIPPVVASWRAGPGPAGGRAAGKTVLLLVCQLKAGGCGRVAISSLSGRVKTQP